MAETDYREEQPRPAGDSQGPLYDYSTPYGPTVSTLIDGRRVYPTVVDLLREAPFLPDNLNVSVQWEPLDSIPGDTGEFSTTVVGGKLKAWPFAQLIPVGKISNSLSQKGGWVLASGMAINVTFNENHTITLRLAPGQGNNNLITQGALASAAMTALRLDQRIYAPAGAQVHCEAFSAGDSPTGAALFLQGAEDGLSVSQDRCFVSYSSQSGGASTVTSGWVNDGNTDLAVQSLSGNPDQGTCVLGIEAEMGIGLANDTGGCAGSLLQLDASAGDRSRQGSLLAGAPDLYQDMLPNSGRWFSPVLALADYSGSLSTSTEITLTAFGRVGQQPWGAEATSPVSVLEVTPPSDKVNTYATITDAYAAATAGSLNPGDFVQTAWTISDEDRPGDTGRWLAAWTGETFLPHPASMRPPPGAWTDDLERADSLLKVLPGYGTAANFTINPDNSMTVAAEFADGSPWVGGSTNNAVVVYLDFPFGEEDLFSYEVTQRDLVEVASDDQLYGGVFFGGTDLEDSYVSGIQPLVGTGHRLFARIYIGGTQESDDQSAYAVPTNRVIACRVAARSEGSSGSMTRLPEGIAGWNAEVVRTDSMVAYAALGSVRAGHVTLMKDNGASSYGCVITGLGNMMSRPGASIPGLNPPPAGSGSVVEPTDYDTVVELLDDAENQPDYTVARVTWTPKSWISGDLGQYITQIIGGKVMNAPYVQEIPAAKIADFFGAGGWLLNGIDPAKASFTADDTITIRMDNSEGTDSYGIGIPNAGIYLDRSFRWPKAIGHTVTSLVDGVGANEWFVGGFLVPTGAPVSRYHGTLHQYDGNDWACFSVLDEDGDTSYESDGSVSADLKSYPVTYHSICTPGDNTLSKTGGVRSTFSRAVTGSPTATVITTDSGSSTGLPPLLDGALRKGSVQEFNFHFLVGNDGGGGYTEAVLGSLGQYASQPWGNIIGAGPTAVGGGGTLPITYDTITDAYVAVAAGDLEAGDRVRVSWTALDSNPNDPGVWTSTVNDAADGFDVPPWYLMPPPGAITSDLTDPNSLLKILHGDPSLFTINPDKSLTIAADFTDGSTDFDTGAATWSAVAVYLDVDDFRAFARTSASIASMNPNGYFIAGVGQTPGVPGTNRFNLSGMAYQSAVPNFVSTTQRKWDGATISASSVPALDPTAVSAFPAVLTWEAVMNDDLAAQRFFTGRCSTPLWDPDAAEDYASSISDPEIAEDAASEWYTRNLQKSTATNRPTFALYMENSVVSSLDCVVSGFGGVIPFNDYGPGYGISGAAVLEDPYIWIESMDDIYAQDATTEEGSVFRMSWTPPDNQVLPGNDEPGLVYVDYEKVRSTDVVEDNYEPPLWEHYITPKLAGSFWNQTAGNAAPALLDYGGADVSIDGTDPADDTYLATSNYGDFGVNRCKAWEVGPAMPGIIEFEVLSKYTGTKGYFNSGVMTDPNGIKAVSWYQDSTQFSAASRVFVQKAVSGSVLVSVAALSPASEWESARPKFNLFNSALAAVTGDLQGVTGTSTPNGEDSGRVLLSGTTTDVDYITPYLKSSLDAGNVPTKAYICHTDVVGVTRTREVMCFRIKRKRNKKRLLIPRGTHENPVEYPSIGDADRGANPGDIVRVSWPAVAGVQEAGEYIGEKLGPKSFSPDPIAVGVPWGAWDRTVGGDSLLQNKSSSTAPFTVNPNKTVTVQWSQAEAQVFYYAAVPSIGLYIDWPTLRPTVLRTRYDNWPDSGASNPDRRLCIGWSKSTAENWIGVELNQDTAVNNIDLKNRALWGGGPVNDSKAIDRADFTGAPGLLETHIAVGDGTMGIATRLWGAADTTFEQDSSQLTQSTACTEWRTELLRPHVFLSSDGADPNYSITLGEFSGAGVATAGSVHVVNSIEEAIDNLYVGDRFAILYQAIAEDTATETQTLLKSGVYVGQKTSTRGIHPMPPPMLPKYWGTLGNVIQIWGQDIAGVVMNENGTITITWNDAYVNGDGQRQVYPTLGDSTYEYGVMFDVDFDNPTSVGFLYESDIGPGDVPQIWGGMWTGQYAWWGGYHNYWSGQSGTTFRAAMGDGTTWNYGTANTGVFANFGANQHMWVRMDRRENDGTTSYTGGSSCQALSFAKTDLSWVDGLSAPAMGLANMAPILRSSAQKPFIIQQHTVGSPSGMNGTYLTLRYLGAPDQAPHAKPLDAAPTSMVLTREESDPIEYPTIGAILRLAEIGEYVRTPAGYVGRKTGDKQLTPCALGIELSPAAWDSYVGGDSVWQLRSVSSDWVTVNSGGTFTVTPEDAQADPGNFWADAANNCGLYLDYEVQRMREVSIRISDYDAPGVATQERSVGIGLVKSQATLQGSRSYYNRQSTGTFLAYGVGEAGSIISTSATAATVTASQDKFITNRLIPDATTAVGVLNRMVDDYGNTTLPTVAASNLRTDLESATLWRLELSWRLRNAPGSWTHDLLTVGGTAVTEHPVEYATLYDAAQAPVGSRVRVVQEANAGLNIPEITFDARRTDDPWFFDVNPMSVGQWAFGKIDSQIGAPGSGRFLIYHAANATPFSLLASGVIDYEWTDANSSISWMKETGLERKSVGIEVAIPVPWGGTLETCSVFPNTSESMAIIMGGMHANLDFLGMLHGRGGTPSIQNYSIVGTGKWNAFTTATATHFVGKPCRHQWVGHNVTTGSGTSSVNYVRFRSTTNTQGYTTTHGGVASTWISTTRASRPGELVYPFIAAYNSGTGSFTGQFQTIGDMQSMREYIFGTTPA